MSRFRGWPKWLKWSIALLIVLAVSMSLFPGRRLGMAVTIATGVGRGILQERVDELETKAIAGTRFSADDEEFLRDLYGTLATGGKLSLVIAQTGKMLEHYLDATGADYRLDPVIFTSNDQVRAQARALRARAASAGCRAGARFSSPTFYMPDRSNFDSVFGLYHGTLHLTQSVDHTGECRHRFRAEVPWTWPSYSLLTQKYGDPHAESFPIPSLRSLVFGQQHALFIDNGLGGHLAALNLARPFLAYAEWSEPSP